MGCRKLFIKTENSIETINKKTSYQVYHFFKKGDFVLITGEDNMVIHDLGLAISTGLSTGNNIFFNDTLIQTPNQQKVLYLNHGGWESEENTVISDFTKNYFTELSYDKQYKNQFPFSTCNNQVNLFAFDFWKHKSSNMLKEAMFKNDVVVINDYNSAFAYKQMKPKDVKEFLTPYLKKNITFVVLYFSNLDMKDKLSIEADVILNIKNRTTEEDYKHILEVKKGRNNYKEPFYLKHEVINI